MNKPLLSICVVTMNRAQQLKEALESCLACDLPSDTEFVIIDNASTDETEYVVRDVIGRTNYHCYYEKVKQNLGCGGGRNYAFEKASGEYIYVLDDDAIIDAANADFFQKAISQFETHPEIVTLTTQIYDTAWQNNRINVSAGTVFDHLLPCYMFCGGSHFMRKAFFKSAPYLGNKYGFEELVPSLLVADAQCVNAVCSELRVIHKPLIDKWNRQDNRYDGIVVNECAVKYAIKKMMYPRMFSPVLRLAYEARCRKHLRDISEGKIEADRIVRETMTLYAINQRIKIKTVIRLWKQFGLSVF